MADTADVMLRKYDRDGNLVLKEGRVVRWEAEGNRWVMTWDTPLSFRDGESFSVHVCREDDWHRLGCIWPLEEDSGE